MGRKCLKSRQEARCNSVVEYPHTVPWVTGSILHGKPIELFLIPVSDPRLV